NLSWSSGGTGTVNYQIAYQTGATAPSTCSLGTVIPAATQGAANSRSVTGLSSSTQYSFRVCATNGAGTLTAGVTASATTSGGSSPGAPTNVTGTIGNAQVALSWAAPASDGGSSITDYVVQYAAEGYTTQSYTLSQSSNYADSCSSNTASSLYDGNLGNGSGTSSSSNEFVRADLGSAMTVARIRLSPLPQHCGWGPSYLNGKTLQYSSDGTNWTTYVTISGVTEGAYRDYLPDVTARYWRIQSSSSWLGVGEFVIQTGSAQNWVTFDDGTSTATSATLTGLTNGTGYVFRVAAVNGIGTGSYSINSASLTPLAVAGAPTSVAGVAGNAQVSLTWAAPSSNGGSAITDYVIQFSSNSGTSWSTFSDGTSTATSAAVTGLVNGTAYVFRVAAVNSAGTGSYSTNSGSVTPTASTPGAPTSVAGTIGNTQVSLTWVAPSSNGGSAITDYVIQFSSNSGTSWSTFGDGTSTATSATVTGLVNGTAYIFRVAAVNSAGTGSYSSNSASVIPSTTPGAPTTVVGNVGNTAVPLTWRVPSSNGGGAITDYVIQFSSNSGTSWSTFSDGTSTTTSATVTGLTNGTAYIFRVAAVN
ncbi:hypothetical protein EBQ90_00140, partial [bacterium]|nr:hypothetical protein [bacterium]